MYILIDNKSGAPIYDQIVAQIKRQILDGSLAEDEALPLDEAQPAKARTNPNNTREALSARSGAMMKKPEACSTKAITLRPIPRTLFCRLIWM